MSVLFAKNVEREIVDSVISITEGYKIWDGPIYEVDYDLIVKGQVSPEFKFMSTLNFLAVIATALYFSEQTYDSFFGQEGANDYSFDKDIIRRISIYIGSFITEGNSQPFDLNAKEVRCLSASATSGFEFALIAIKDDHDIKSFMLEDFNNCFMQIQESQYRSGKLKHMEWKPISMKRYTEDINTVLDHLLANPDGIAFL